MLMATHWRRKEKYVVIQHLFGGNNLHNVWRSGIHIVWCVYDAQSKQFFFKSLPISVIIIIFFDIDSEHAGWFSLIINMRHKRQTENHFRERLKIATHEEFLYGEDVKVVSSNPNKTKPKVFVICWHAHQTCKYMTIEK